MESVPDNVLKLVLHYLLATGRDSPRMFRHNLFYLSICPRWRKLGKPMVFRRAFIDYEELKKSEDGSVAGSPYDGIAEAESKHVKLTSNLDLAQAASCSDAIRHIDIRVTRLDNSITGLSKIEELLKNVPVPNQIEHMSMVMYTKTRIMDDKNTVDIPKAKLANLSQAMAKYLPEIKHLTVWGADSDRIAHVLYGQIAEHYAEQLVKLACLSPIKLSKLCNFTQLEHAKLKITDISDILAIKLCAEKLKTLQIISEINTYPLDFFTMFDSSTDIKFPNLQELSLHYPDTSSDDAAQSHLDSADLKLVLPNLTKLVVHDSASNYNHCVLSRMLLPSCIDSIDIQTSSSVYDALGKRPLPAANKVKLSDQDIKGNPSVVYNMDQTLNIFQSCQSATMEISNFRIPVNADDITSTTLTCLKISAPIHITTVISLLEKLPNLTELTVDDVASIDLPQAINVPQLSLYKQHPLAPFSTSLRKIDLGCNITKYSDELMIPVVLCFLFKLPMLQELKARQVPENIFFAQLELYRPFYPHISKVEFDLNSSIH